MQDRIDLLKPRKAAGHDGIVNEHLIYGGPNLTVHLSLLFTAVLRHSFVPDSFRFGIIKPIPKNKHGDLTNIDMYRGITKVHKDDDDNDVNRVKVKIFPSHNG